METETKFERGEVVYVHGGGNSGVRIFSHYECGMPVFVFGGHEGRFFAGENYEPETWSHAERLPKPSPFRKGELVVCKPDHDQSNTVAFFADEKHVTSKLLGSNWPCQARDFRRPTIKELNKWLPWCEIKEKE